MNAPTSAPVADDKPLPVKSASEEFPAQIENDTERTKSSLGCRPEFGWNLVAGSPVT